MPAWWSARVADFLQCEPESIVGALSTRLVETHPLNRATQVQAWRAQIALLRQALGPSTHTWRLLFEYPLLRLARRIDAVLLTDTVIIVLEFKVGASSFTNIDRQQVEDYALDLLDFHADSRGYPLVPVLVATGAEARGWQWPLLWHGVTPVFDWAVIVALVGGGQEINTGEAGLAAWGEALTARPHWRILAADTVLHAEAARQRLFQDAPPTLTLDPALHLDVPVRSVRSSAAAPWVDAVLRGDAKLARSIADAAGDLPFLLTRSLSEMRNGLRQLARGARRAGLVCSAGARRLVPEGIWPNFPHTDADAVANWFLQRWPDVRASDALELPATQFACQGLELDQVGLCWGNDLIRRTGRSEWVARNFSGTRWLETRAEAAIAYQVNTYRVLLTRARYETIIWVARGDADDPTRPVAEFDAIATFLGDCGAQPLGTSRPEVGQAAPNLLLI